MRLPIVSTNVGGIPNLLTNKDNALLVDYGKNSDLAEAISLMINDRELRRNIIQNASKTMDEVFKKMDLSQISKLIKTHF